MVIPRRSWSRGELCAHLHAERGVEVRERLVHQEHLGLSDQRAAERDPLSLAARERGGTSFEQLRDVERLGDLAHAGADARARLVPRLHAEREVLPHVHVRVQRIALEDERDVAVARRDARDVAAVDRDAPVGRPLEPGEHPERRRLSAPRGPDEHEELAAPDLEVEVAHGCDRPEELVDAGERDVHGRGLGRRRARLVHGTGHGGLIARLDHPFRLPPKLNAPLSRRAIARYRASTGTENSSE